MVDEFIIIVAPLIIAGPSTVLHDPFMYCAM